MPAPDKIIHEIYRYARKKYFYNLAGNSIFFGLLFFVLWLSVSLADTVFYFSEITRWGLFALNIPVMLFLIFHLLYKPFRLWLKLDKQNDLSEIAVEIGLIDDGIKDNLVNIYQLNNESPSLLRNAAIEQLSSKLKVSDFTEKLTLKSYTPRLLILISILFSAFFIVTMQSGELYNSTKRLLNPASEYLKVPPFRFNVSPGNVDVLSGSPFEIRADYSGPLARQIKMVLKFLDSGIERIITLEKNSTYYQGRIQEVIKPFSYYLTASTQNNPELDGNIVSDLYKVNVLVPPLVKELKLKIEGPDYAESSSHENDLNDGNVTALKGSNIDVKIVSNKIIKKAALLFANKDTVQLNSKGKIAETNFTIKSNTSYKISLLDTEGINNLAPIVYTVNMLKDNAPYVDIVEPGQDIEAQLEDIISLRVDAADDYGITNIKIMYRYIKGDNSKDSTWNVHKRKYFGIGQTNAQFNTFFDFSDFYVGYNDEMEYFAEAYDNNSVDGNAFSKSPIYSIRFPSLDELFNDFTTKEDEKIEDLQNTAEESEKLKEKLEEINRELKRTGKLDWELKKQIENAIEKQKSSQEKIEQVQQELEQMIEKLDQNNLMDPEILEKYNKLQSLFKEIATPELLSAMQKLQQALEKANPKDVEKALQSFKLNQEAFQQNLERTLELFKQVQLEQQMDQLVQQAEKLTQNQKEISEKSAEDNSEARNKELENEQKGQEELLKSLERNIEQMLAKQEMEKFKESKKQLNEAGSKIDQQKMIKQMQEIIQKMQQKNMQQAAGQSQKTEQSLQQMQQDLSSAMQSMQQAHKQNVQKKMLSAAQKMLKLSHEQENVQRQTQDASQLNDDLREMARKQSQLQENLSKLLADLIDLSKETFFLNPDLNKNLANAYNNMQQGLNDLSERRNGQAAADQQKAMEALNRGIGSIQKSMSQLQSSQSGTGFDQFMEQLKQMAGAQGGLNDETMNFLEGEGNQGQLSAQQQAESQRLAAQQKALQQALQEMSEQMGNRSDVLGRLNEMGDQMEEIIQDMLANNVNRTTVERQQQILSRMLDAQKSTREREFSKKRKAEQAKKYSSRDPRNIGEFEIDAQKRLQEALKKALSEGYHTDYQKLIEAYFNELSQKQSQN